MGGGVNIHVKELEKENLFKFGSAISQDDLLQISMWTTAVKYNSQRGKLALMQKNLEIYHAAGVSSFKLILC